MRQQRIMSGDRLVAELTTHSDRLDRVTIELRVWFDSTLSQREREIVIINYLNELAKGM